MLSDIFPYDYDEQAINVVNIRLNKMGKKLDDEELRLLKYEFNSFFSDRMEDGPGKVKLILEGNQLTVEKTTNSGYSGQHSYTVQDK